MKFGLFGGAKASGQGPAGDSLGYRHYIDYVLLAEQLGLHSAFIVEHHFTGVGQVSASLGVLSYLAARTSRLRLGTADGHQCDRHRDDRKGHQQHQDDTAVPPRRLVGGEGLRRGIVVGFGGHASG